VWLGDSGTDQHQLLVVSVIRCKCSLHVTGELLAFNTPAIACTKEGGHRWFVNLQAQAERAVMEHYGLRFAERGIKFRIEVTATSYNAMIQERRAVLATAIITYADAIEAQSIVLGSQPRSLVDRILRGPGAPLTVAQCCEKMTHRRLVQRPSTADVNGAPPQQLVSGLTLPGPPQLPSGPFVIKSRGYQDVVVQIGAIVA
jgi:nucleotide-binding universal stress UspA family protein